MHVTLTPAFGRDYTSKAKVLADYHAGKDFTLNAYGNHWDGKPINKPQVEAAGYRVTFRYHKLLKTCIL